jgi:hypothetical protein
MKDYKVNASLRLRSYESGYVVEKFSKSRDGKKHWTGVMWFGSIPAALVGLSDYLVRHSKEDLPQALKESINDLVRAQKAVLAEGAKK